MAGIALLKRSYEEFFQDGCLTMAAALAYYAVFALPGLLVILMAVLGTIMDASNAHSVVTGQVEALIGNKGAAQIRGMLESAQAKGNGSLGAWVGFLTLAFSATGIMVQLQSALNTAWEVQPDPKQGGVKNFLLKRLLSLTVILGMAFLLLASLTLSTIITAVEHFAADYLPAGFSASLIAAANSGVSLAVTGIMFTVMFRFFPDAKVRWRDAAVGGAVTAVLFAAGKSAIAWYLGTGSVVSTFGAARSLALVLLWIYYSSAILLFGAEFTQTWATRDGGTIEPARGAVRIPKKLPQYQSS